MDQWSSLMSNPHGPVGTHSRWMTLTLPNTDPAGGPSRASISRASADSVLLAATACSSPRSDLRVLIPTGPGGGSGDLDPVWRPGGG